MSSKKDLKKDINFVFEELIGAVYIKELVNASETSKNSEVLVDKIIIAFDDLITKVNDRKVENAKSHFKSIRAELNSHATNLLSEINK